MLLMALGICLCPNKQKDNKIMSYNAIHATVLRSECLLKQYLYMFSIVYPDNVFRFTSHPVVKKETRQDKHPTLSLKYYGVGFLKHNSHIHSHKY